MKKLLAFLMAGMMTATAFAGCGAANSSKTEETKAESAASGAASTAAEDDWAYIQNKGEMVIGITYFEPMNYKDDKGELTGFETEFATAVCGELGVKPKFQEIEWDSKELELSSKAIDCIWNGMTITPERQENMGISTPYMENKQVMVCKADKAEQFAKDVTGASVVAEAGSAGEDVAKGDDFFKSAEFQSVESQATALLEVKAGTADIAVIDYVMSIGTLREGSDYADLKVIEEKSFSPEQYGVALRKNSTAVEKVNAAMQAVADNGKLAEIAGKYSLTDLLLIKAK